MDIFIIILFIFSLVFLFYAIYKSKHTNKINKEIEKENEKLLNFQNSLQEQIKNTEFKIDFLQQQKQQVLSELDTIQNTQQTTYELYSKMLDNQYEEKDKEYNDLLFSLQSSYEKEQSKLIQQCENVKQDLEKLKTTRAAAIQAKLKEQEIKDNVQFYCLCPKNSDIVDIRALERIKPELNNPRILSMLIWSTYFQKPMTALCNQVLGLNTVCGIYKITNLQNDMCYIGQSVDIAKRWKDHAKCGLGIDTPQGNKLYKAMQSEGIWNFSWELLEKCPREDLDSKEKFYIGLYQSNEFGYNSTRGNGK